MRPCRVPPLVAVAAAFAALVVCTSTADAARPAANCGRFAGQCCTEGPPCRDVFATCSGSTCVSCGDRGFSCCSRKEYEPWPKCKTGTCHSDNTCGGPTTGKQTSQAAPDTAVDGPRSVSGALGPAFEPASQELLAAEGGQPAPCSAADPEDAAAAAGTGLAEPAAPTLAASSEPAKAPKKPAKKSAAAPRSPATATKQATKKAKAARCGWTGEACCDATAPLPCREAWATCNSTSVCIPCGMLTLTCCERASGSKLPPCGAHMDCDSATNKCVPATKKDPSTKCIFPSLRQYGSTTAGAYSVTACINRFGSAKGQLLTLNVRLVNKNKTDATAAAKLLSLPDVDKTGMAKPATTMKSLLDDTHFQVFVSQKGATDKSPYLRFIWAPSTRWQAHYSLNGSSDGETVISNMPEAEVHETGIQPNGDRIFQAKLMITNTTGPLASLVTSDWAVGIGVKLEHQQGGTADAWADTSSCDSPSAWAQPTDFSPACMRSVELPLRN